MVELCKFVAVLSFWYYSMLWDRNFGHAAWKTSNVAFAANADLLAAKFERSIQCPPEESFGA